MLPLAAILISALPPVELAIGEIVEDERARAELVEHLQGSVSAAAARLSARTGARPEEIEAGLREQIASNLIDKLSLAKDDHPFPLDADSLRRTVIDYELFKAEKFVSSGVFPKRYFGFFDEKWDTAALESTMRRTIQACVDESNRVLTERGSKQRITDMEVAITFLAEGGALLLSEPETHDLAHIHPVQGIGLDDISIGFLRQPELLARLDRRLGTGLRALVDRSDRGPRLRRDMTFEEAIAGTTVMWVYEKELAAAKLLKAEKRRLEELPPNEQFIFGSLVYNSGLIFSSSRMRMIRDFETAAYLDRLSRENEQRRWRLPLFATRRSMELLLSEHRYPWQPTSWSAVYHVLQRYGAYTAIERLTHVFDAKGRFVAPPT